MLDVLWAKLVVEGRQETVTAPGKTVLLLKLVEQQGEGDFCIVCCHVTNARQYHYCNINWRFPCLFSNLVWESVLAFSSVLRENTFSFFNGFHPIPGVGSNQRASSSKADKPSSKTSRELAQLPFPGRSVGITRSRPAESM